MPRAKLSPEERKERQREANRRNMKRRRETPDLRNRDRQRSKEWALRNRGTERFKRTRKDRDLKRAFGISLNEYERIHEEQSGTCLICKRPESVRGLSLAVDHDHTTGKVRGLLCGACNTGLEKFRDSPELLEKAAEYLRAR